MNKEAEAKQFKGLMVLVAMLAILILACFLRFYKLDQIPSSLNWDEIDAGYNAYTIANWGRDEWGQSFPYIFTSFHDDKHPVHIYTAALFIKLFGLSDFVTRSPGATFGVLNVLLIFFLAKIIFKNDTVAILSAFLLAISPYDIHFSRGLWETNFAVFYFMLGLLLFYQGLKRKNWFLTLAFLSFDISMLSYHSGKVVVPITIFGLIGLYFPRLIYLKWKFYIGVLVFLAFILAMVLDPRLSGLARVEQTKFPAEVIQQTKVYQQTHNSELALASIVVHQYFLHFEPDFLYKIGDPSPRNSSKNIGEFYRVEVFYFLIGLVFLLYYRQRWGLILLIWLLAAPIPSAVVQGAPNATRSLYMLGVFQLISAFGIWQFLQQIKKIKFRSVAALLIIIAFLFSLKEYTDYYFTKYNLTDAQDWQYGMKQIVQNVQKHPEYSTVYMTDIRSQPYIFFLYYLKTPLPEFLKTVKYNEDPKTKSFNLVAQYDNFHFGGWNEIDSAPTPAVMYIVEPSKYSGLKYGPSLYTIERIDFPNNDPAFYMVGEGY